MESTQTPLLPPTVPSSTPPGNLPSTQVTTRLTCLVSEIDTSDLLRQDVGDVSDIVASIKQNLEEGLPALIHPVVLDSRMRLISGSRRLAAHKLLKLTHIDYLFIGILDEATRIRLEVAANYQKVFNWKENVLAVDKYHRHYVLQAALQSKSWGVRESELVLKTAKSTIQRATHIATYLRANDPEICACENIKEAFQVLLKRREDELSRALVAASIPKGNTVAPKKLEIGDVTDEEFFASEGSTGFTPGIGLPIDLDERPGDNNGAGQVEGGSKTQVIIPLSSMFHHADAVAFTRTLPAETFDAVITDWPYGNDPDNMEAQVDLTDLRETHGVEYCKQLHRDIVPEIFRVLKPNAWFITWTDMDLWQHDYDICVAAGFQVQRWPLTWHKTSSCGNTCAQFNTTKNTEIAIKCRKGNATLIRPQASSIWSGGNDAETKAYDHAFAKPAGLWEWLYSMTCIRGSAVYDPFVGSGSSVVPAIRLGLRPTGVEKTEIVYNKLHVNMSNFYRSLDPTCQFK
jgi:site-specific DNA-methyltransferase (adenine-specific)